MVLKISPDRTIGDLQTEFLGAFPGLKIAFFSKPHKAFKGSAAKFLIQKKEMPLLDLAPDIPTGELHIERTTTVQELEEAFTAEFGLNVQVFRKSGRTWLETSVTDSLTLEEQMARAAASENIQQTFVDPMDYREQD